MRYLSLIGLGKKKSKPSKSQQELNDLIATTLKDLPAQQFDPFWRGYEKYPFGLPGHLGQPPKPPLPWYKKLRYQVYGRPRNYVSRMFYAIKAAHKDELYDGYY